MHHKHPLFPVDRILFTSLGGQEHMRFGTTANVTRDSSRAVVLFAFVLGMVAQSAQALAPVLHIDHPDEPSNVSTSPSPRGL